MSTPSAPTPPSPVPHAPIPHAVSRALETAGAGASVHVSHGFYGSVGGVSSGLYASLNTGTGSDDVPGNVTENRARVARDIGAAEPADLVSLYQIHSARAVRLDVPPAVRPEADAMVTTAPGLALCILTADCAPILFADAEAGVIGAAHAGWKGALGGVLEACVAEMERAGAHVSQITAAIGPCIHAASYEVGPEFRDRFVADDAGNDRFFQAGMGDRFHFDLPGYVARRLHWSCGLATVDTISHDTCALETRYFSNRRRNKARLADYGRNASVIMIQP
ncbi:MAG: peptidoglycan editing factor PgeF [Pseudomonadota bacterium]